jgi:hypothetical protein
MQASPLQQGKSLSAWMAQAQAGVNLGISPMHGCSVALVLSLKTGLASPQFHGKHDNLFKTTARQLGGYRMPRLHWQELSAFKQPMPLIPRGSRLHPSETTRTITLHSQSTMTPSTLPQSREQRHREVMMQDLLGRRKAMTKSH